MAVKKLLAISTLALAGGSVFAAELTRDAVGVAVPPRGFPASERELKWDNGTLGYVKIHLDAGTWVGNDFDVSTLSARNVKSVRIFSTGAWPNNRWDGSHIALFNLRGTLPGTMLWGPKYVSGWGEGYRWCNFGVDYRLPKGVGRFVAATEQIYNYPNCDPYCLDTGSPQRRGWRYYRGVWEPLGAYTNLMLRVVMQGDVGVEPTSIGRVKALYH